MPQNEETNTQQSALSKLANWSNLWERNIVFFLIACVVTRYHFTLENIITPDEFAWVIQSIHFRQALIEQDWPRMVQSAHPGFITMWLGSIGTTIKLWLTPELQPELNWILQQSWVRPQAGELSHRLFPFLQPARNVLSVAMAGLWTALFTLLKQRIRPVFACATVMLLLSDMWLVGLTNILHVDGLLAMFSLITLLLVLPQSDSQLGFYGRWRYVLTGAAVAGAILSKVPGLLLLAIVPAVLLVQAWLTQKSPVRPLAFMFGGLLLTTGLCAPIIFIDPAYVFENVFVLTARETGFTAPTFFMGQVTDEPGLLFYPLTVLFRQRGITTVGLVLGMVHLWRRRNGHNQWLFIGTIMLFSLLFWLGLLVSDREFSRYALPAALPITLLGSYAFVKGYTQNSGSVKRFFSQSQAAAQASTLFWVIVAASVTIVFRNDPFQFVNPLAGGPWSGPQLMLTGWGGPQTQIYINRGSQYLDASQKGDIFTDNVTAIAPFVHQGHHNVFLLTPETAWLIQPEDLVILSVENEQLNPDRWKNTDAASAKPLFERLPNGVEPLYTGRFLGKKTAYIYGNFDQTFLDQGLTRLTADNLLFNSQLQLVQAALIKPDDDFNVHILLRWNHQQPEDGILQFKIVDTAKNVWIQREDPLFDIEERAASRWTAGHTYLTMHKLPLASDMPPGGYTVQVSHFRPDGSLSGVTNINGQFLGTTADLATLPVTVPSPQPPVALPENSPSNSQITAVADFPTLIGQGEFVDTNVWVTHTAATAKQHHLELTLGDVVLTYPIDTEGWQSGFTYQVKARWQIPADLPAGDYPIFLNRLGLGTLTVEARERNFALPAGESVGVQFGDVLELFAADWTADENTFEVGIVWRALGNGQADYTTFIHLKDGAGNVLAQSDLQPGKATSQVIQGEVVRFSADVPLNGIDPTLIKGVAIGFYDPLSGQRLPAVSKSGEPLPNNQLELIIEADE